MGGTGVIPTLQQIIDAHAFIKSILRGFFNDHVLKLDPLWGSVSPNNAEQIFELEVVDGGLIGDALH